MNEVVLGLAAMCVGGLLCFGGLKSSKVMMSFWASFVGFLAGSGIVAASNGEGWLQTSMGWLMGLLLAVVMFLVAYSFYELALVSFLGSAGFLLTAGFMSIFDIDWSWTAGLVVGLAGAVIALSSFAMEVPRSLLVAMSVLVGGLVFVQGFMVMVGVTSLMAFESGSAIAMPSESWGWLVTWLLVASSGAYAQMNSGMSPVGTRGSWK